MSRRGRNRKFCRRQPNGQPSRLIADLGPVIPPEALDQRARIVGENFSRDSRAGSAIGRLTLTGRIRQHHYEAGLLLYRSWGSWQRLAEIPARNPKTGSYDDMVSHGPRPEIDPAEWMRVRARYLGAVEAIVRRGGHFSWAAVDSLVIDDVAPPRAFDDGPLGQRVFSSMLGGLNALVDFFHVPIVTGDEDIRAA